MVLKRGRGGLDQELFRLHAELCKTLGNPTRLRIIEALREGEKTVTELTEIVGAKQANVSQHLAILRQNAVVADRRQGLNVYYGVANPKMVQACNLIREVLLERLTEEANLVKEMSR
ncbi:MAG: ArsR/SmtB family transcription factor [Candidatus Geothermarchaeales archaeon]